MESFVYDRHLNSQLKSCLIFISSQNMIIRLFNKYWSLAYVLEPFWGSNHSSVVVPFSNKASGSQLEKGDIFLKHTHNWQCLETSGWWSLGMLPNIPQGTPHKETASPKLEQCRDEQPCSRAALLGKECAVSTFTIMPFYIQTAKIMIDSTVNLWRARRNLHSQTNLNAFIDFF